MINPNYIAPRQGWEDDEPVLAAAGDDQAQENPEEERADQFEGLNDVPLYAGDLEHDPHMDALMEDIDDPTNLVPPTTGVSASTSAQVGVDVAGPSELPVNVV